MASPSPKLGDWTDSEFAVYKYIPNQETIEQDEAPQTRAGQGFSLTLVGTSISSDREPFLREHVATRITHSSLYRSNGQVTTLDPQVFPPSSQSYHCLLEIGEEQLFLISFMSIGKQGLDLFRTELDSYCKSLTSLLLELPEDNLFESFPASTLESRIRNWSYENVEYMSRVVVMCQSQLPLLLNTAAESAVEVAGPNAQAVNDIKQFLDACSLANLMQFSSQIQPSGPGVKVWATKDGCQITGAESNKFSENWSGILLAQGASSPDPYFLRQVVENYKLKVIQDLNALKRLLRQAETDYHSLFRCYVFMSSCGSGGLLLQCALQEAQTLGAQETIAVLETIRLYTDTYGFRQSVVT